MKKQYKTIAISILVFSLLLSGCGPGQLFGPTITPTPTITNTPTLTSTSTPTLTPTSTLTPTETPIPIKIIRVERGTTIPVKDMTEDGITIIARYGFATVSTKDEEVILIQIETDQEITTGTCVMVKNRCDSITGGDLVLIDEAGNKYFSYHVYGKNGEYIFRVLKTAQNLILIVKGAIRIPLP